MQALNDIIIGKSGVAQIIKLGELNITSGKICACDPLIESYFVGFEQEVNPGKYPVELYLEEDTDLVGMAVVWFEKTKNIAEWRMATVPGETISEQDLEDGYILGFPVESGLACFMDPQGSTEFLKLEDQVNDSGEASESVFLGPLLDENGGDWALAPLPDGHNIAAFSSGYGDGNYACYWGLDGNGKICALAMDLDVFFTEEEL